MFSSHTETFTQRRATWPWHVIHIKAEKFCETSATVHLSRSHPQCSAGWDLCLICYQTQLVFPADVHSPAAMNCVKICQGWCPKLLTSGVSLWYTWQTLVPKVLNRNKRQVCFLNGDTYTCPSVWWDPSSIMTDHSLTAVSLELFQQNVNLHESIWSMKDLKDLILIFTLSKHYFLLPTTTLPTHTIKIKQHLEIVTSGSDMFHTTLHTRSCTVAWWLRCYSRPNV